MFDSDLKKLAYNTSKEIKILCDKIKHNNIDKQFAIYYIITIIDFHNR